MRLYVASARAAGGMVYVRRDTSRQARRRSPIDDNQSIAIYGVGG
jgi:hypothetical protein